MSVVVLVYVFFSSRRRHTRCLIDWSSDVCSSDLGVQEAADRRHAEPAALGMSPIGGLLHPVGADEEGGLLVEIRSEERRVGEECGASGATTYEKERRTREGVKAGEITSAYARVCK